MTNRHPVHLARFSYGGPLSDLVDVAVWKFDVHLPGGNLHDSQITAYVKCEDRGDAYMAFFSKHPQAKIFGTGFPLTEEAVHIELGRPMSDGEVTLVSEGTPPG